MTKMCQVFLHSIFLVLLFQDINQLVICIGAIFAYTLVLLPLCGFLAKNIFHTTQAAR